MFLKLRLEYLREISDMIIKIIPIKKIREFFNLQDFSSLLDIITSEEERPIKIIKIGEKNLLRNSSVKGPKISILQPIKKLLFFIETLNF